METDLLESDATSIVMGVFFFFQAEDGIRDIGVTGVQTCALPICELPEELAAHAAQEAARQEHRTEDERDRSEERRVGKSVDLGGRRNIKKKKKNARTKSAKQAQTEAISRKTPPCVGVKIHTTITK